MDSNLTPEELKDRWEAAKARERISRANDIVPKSLGGAVQSPQSGSAMNRTQGYIIIAIGCLILGFLIWNVFKPLPKYQYRVVNVQAQFTKGAGEDSEIGPTSVTLKDEELSILGKEGWELVETFLEMETTHPNYGSGQYVTGLQPNIRPQRVVMVFRKAI